MDNVLAALMPDNRRVARLCIATGLRLSDVLSLRTADLAERMTVRESKTGKTRRVYIPRKLLPDLREHAGEVWVFPGRKPGTHRTRQAVWKDVKRAAKAFRLPQNVAPHSFRKVYAVELMRKYGDLGKVQKVLGHSDPMTTMLYALADKLVDDELTKR